MVEIRELRESSERTNYETRTSEAVLTWKSLAKKKRKAKLKEAHLEVRRRVKKGMGARCIVQWRQNLEVSYARYERMNLTLEEFTADREWDFTVQAFDTWRLRAQEKAQLHTLSNVKLIQKGWVNWRKRTTGHGVLRVEANEHWKERAASKALKDWKLSSLQIQSRRETVDKHLNKDRKLQKQGFEGWYGSTADKLVPTQLSDGSYRSVANMIQDAQSQFSQTQAMGLFSAWRATATKGKREQVQVEEEDESERAGQGDEEEASYAPTPARPQILLGSLGRRQTTTPLAPIPQRQPWQGGSQDSVLGRSAPGGTASRSGRPRRNLRVSWAA
jgi:hypothetical protein